MPFLKPTALILLLTGKATVFAQSPIVGFTATYVATSTKVTGYTQKPASNSGSFQGCSGSNFTYGFNKGSDNALKLLNFITNGKNYFLANTTAARVVLRRVDNATVTGNRIVVSMEAENGSSACPAGRTVDIRLPYQDTMENFLNSNFINQGTDNIFTNTGNGDDNNNNIERVDVLFPSGLSTAATTDAGFAIFDRGTNNGHDGFRIAAITGIDANGDPSSFGWVKTCAKGNGAGNGSWGHPTAAAGNRTLSTYVMRKDANETRLRASAAINGQQIGGVFFSFADLGITAGQKVYGYAILSTDGRVNPSSAQLLNLSDATVYPTNTTESYGGLDMMAVSAVFSSGGTPLAATAAELKLKLSEQNAVVSWHLSQLEPNSRIELEQSENGRDFTGIYQITVQNGVAEGRYTASLSKTNYYRLRISNSSAGIRFSNTVRTDGRRQQISVYPNLIPQNQAVVINDLQEGLYQVHITDAQGRIFISRFTISGGGGRVLLPAGLTKGMAWLRFTDSKGIKYDGGKIILQ